MAGTSYMFVTGPDVVKTVTNETATAEELGGAKVHTSKSSVADGCYDNDVEALLQIRRLMDFLPSNNLDGVPEWPSFDDPDRADMSLDTLVPDNPNTPYDLLGLKRAPCHAMYHYFYKALDVAAAEQALGAWCRAALNR